MKELKPSGIDRRRFVASLGILGTAAGMHPLSALAAPEKKPAIAGDIMKCQPYLQAMQTDSVVIRWITHEKCYSWVEYGESKSSLDWKAHHTHDGLVQANNTVNAVLLQHLLPGKKYYYRAVSKKIESFIKGKLTYGETAQTKLYSFTTPKDPRQADAVEFVVFNDIHDRPESFAQLMQHQSGGQNDFVYLNGDMFNNLNTEEQIVEHLLQPLTALFASEVPFIFSRGNHEARGPFARQMAGYFDGREQKFYYSFQAGPMYAIVLDSGEDKEDTHPEYDGIVDFDAYRLKQKEWLQAEVKKKEFRNAKFKVVFVHIPLFYNKNDDAHGAAHCRELWGSILNEAKIDLMISGHKHVHGVHPAVTGKHHYPIVIGGGPFDGRRTIMHIKVTTHTLQLTMKDDNGKVVGELNV